MQAAGPPRNIVSSESIAVARHNGAGIRDVARVSGLTAVMAALGRPVGFMLQCFKGRLAGLNERHRTGNRLDVLDCH